MCSVGQFSDGAIECWEVAPNVSGNIWRIWQDKYKKFDKLKLVCWKYTFPAFGLIAMIGQLSLANHWTNYNRQIKTYIKQTLTFFLRGVITVLLTSCVICLDSAALNHWINNRLTCLVQNKPVKQEAPLWATIVHRDCYKTNFAGCHQVRAPMVQGFSGWFTFTINTPPSVRTFTLQKIMLKVGW